MILLQDSREQAPLVFIPNGIITETHIVTLPIGDYMGEFTDGTRPPIVFERKSLPDLFSTMGRGYKRFKSRILEAQAQQLTFLLLIEGTMADVYAGVPRSSLSGSSVMQKLFTLWVRYNVFPVFCASRSQMVAYIRESLYAIGRNYTRAT